MGKLANFFKMLSENDVEINVNAKGIKAGINGSGLSGHISADALDRGYESLKTKSRKQESLTDNYIRQIEDGSKKYNI